MIGLGTRLRENDDLSLLRAKPYRKSRHFLIVRALITRKIMRSKGCAMQYRGINLMKIFLQKIGTYFNRFLKEPK